MKHTPLDMRERSVLDLLSWAFRDECATVEVRQEDFEKAVGRGYGIGNAQRMIEANLLGRARVDGGGRSFPAEDAEAVAAVVSNLPHDLGGMQVAFWIQALARDGLTPDWHPGTVCRFHPKAWKSNEHGRFGVSEEVQQVELRWWETRRQPDRTMKRELAKARRPVRATPVRLHPDPGYVATLRRDYAAWHAALVWTRDMLAVTPLRRHRVTTDLPPARPWPVTDRMPWGVPEPDPRTPQPSPWRGIVHA